MIREKGQSGGDNLQLAFTKLDNPALIKLMQYLKERGGRGKEMGGGERGEGG